jgi:hypothetical protein
MLYQFSPTDLNPPYWVAMGACTITILAALRIVEMADAPMVAAILGLIAGAAVVFWAFATWLMPALVAAGWWRHVTHRVPLRYETMLWSIVFPNATYAVAGIYLGQADSHPIVGAIGKRVAVDRPRSLGADPDRHGHTPPADCLVGWAGALPWFGPRIQRPSRIARVPGRRTLRIDSPGRQGRRQRRSSPDGGERLRDSPPLAYPNSGHNDVVVSRAWNVQHPHCVGLSPRTEPGHLTRQPAIGLVGVVRDPKFHTSPRNPTNNDVLKRLSNGFRTKSNRACRGCPIRA